MCYVQHTLLSQHKSLPLGIVIAGTLCVSVVVSTPFALSENGLDRSIMDICSRLPLALHIYYLHPNIPLGKWGTLCSDVLEVLILFQCRTECCLELQSYAYL